MSTVGAVGVGLAPAVSTVGAVAVGSVGVGLAPAISTVGAVGVGLC